MDSIINMIMQKLGGGGLASLSQQVGADQQTTSSAMGAAVPMLVSALARNAQQPRGAQAVHQTVSEHDGGPFDNAASYVQSPQQANGGGILERLLGGQRENVQQGLAQTTGMNTSQAARLLEIAAPLVIGYFANQQHQQNLDPGGLAQLLGQHQQQMQQTNPQAAQLLGQLIGR
jgi:hypothetical protein